MKETEAWIKIKRYTDDGKPVCGGCLIWNSTEDFCEFEKDKLVNINLASPGPSCPIWRGKINSESNITKCGHGTRSDMACHACQKEISDLELSAYLGSQEDKPVSEEKRTCIECGMPVEIGEYHPFAACLMFKGCHNSETVRANLDFIMKTDPGSKPYKFETVDIAWENNERTPNDCDYDGFVAGFNAARELKDE